MSDRILSSAKKRLETAAESFSLTEKDYTTLTLEGRLEKKGYIFTITEIERRESGFAGKAQVEKSDGSKFMPKPASGAKHSSVKESNTSSGKTILALVKDLVTTYLLNYVNKDLQADK